MNTRTFLAPAMLLCLLSVGPFASESQADNLYAVTKAGGLYTVSETTAATTFIGAMSGINFNEIEIDPLSGNAYVLYGAGTTTQLLRQVDLGNGSFMGSDVSLAGEFSSLEFAGSKLYGSGAVNGFYEIDPISGVTTLIGSNIRAGGLAYDASSGTMYGVDASGFYSIDLSSGSKSPISPATLGIFRSLDFGSDGRLYAEGLLNLYVLDPATGVATLIGVTNPAIATVTGLAGVAAIPEPESYAMLMAGLGLLGFTAHRRKRLLARTTASRPRAPSSDRR